MSLRINAGSWVFSGAGGRLEVLWPSGTSVVLFGSCTGVVGSESLGESTFYFQEIERVSVIMTEGDRL